MKTLLFVLLCGMTFCLPLKNKPLATNMDEHPQMARIDNGANEKGDIVDTVLSGSARGEVMQPSFVTAETTVLADKKASMVETGTPDTISFAAQIQPILQSRCNPCHFPGGKMYEKMPFDQAKTILDHPEGVLKRIKEGEENRLLKQFFEEAGK